MSTLDIFGYAAAFCTTLAYFPQVLKVYRSKHTKDISIGMFLIMTLGLIFWLIYGVIANSMPIIAANVVTIVEAAYILTMKIKLDYIAPRKKFNKA